jgi:hypothetical protein
LKLRRYIKTIVRATDLDEQVDADNKADPFSRIMNRFQV